MSAKYLLTRGDLSSWLWRKTRRCTVIHLHRTNEGRYAMLCISLSHHPLPCVRSDTLISPRKRAEIQESNNRFIHLRNIELGKQLQTDGLTDGRTGGVRNEITRTNESWLLFGNNVGVLWTARPAAGSAGWLLCSTFVRRPRRDGHRTTGNLATMTSST